MERRLAEPLRALADRLRPKPIMTVSQWADAYRHLSSVSSPEPGRWRTDRVPYLREIMDCFSIDSDVEWIVFRSGTQVGKSEAMNNALGYYMHRHPRPLVMVQPNDEAVADYSSQRITDLIRSTPVLRALVTDQHVRDAEGRKGKDAIAAKAFPGGMLFILPATSKPKLASKPAGVLLFDEVNRAPRELAGEGSPVHVVEHRTQNFVNRRIGIVSTPTDEGDSPICDWYEQTDQCVYEVPCPACGLMQALRFRRLPGVPGGMVWPEGQPELAAYECAGCEHFIDHAKKRDMLAGGRWRATVERPTLARSRGFHLNALYSPWVTWAKLAAKFERAKRDPVQLRDFTIHDLAEAWRAGSGERLDEHELAARVEDGWGAGQAIEVPSWVQVLTSFTDVQDDRLEVSVWGWAQETGGPPRGALIGHWILWGDAPSKGSAVWRELASLLVRQFRTPRGALGISAGGIDSGSGSHADAVYAFVRSGKWQARRQFATKGLASAHGVNDPRPIWPQSIAKHKGRATVVPINVNQAKYHLHMRLARYDEKRPEAALLRFPRRCEPPLVAGPAGYFAQLCAEVLVRTSDAGGRTVKRWKLRKGMDRNEALDCMVGAYAAFVGLRGNLPVPCGEREDLPAAPAVPVRTEAPPESEREPEPIDLPKRRQPPKPKASNLWARLPRR